MQNIPLETADSNSNICYSIPKYMPWLVCFTAALFFFYEFIQMNMFNAIGGDLLKSFHINAEQLGALSACYFYANVLFLLPAGLILDRFSTRKIILLSLFICILGTIAFSMSTNYYLASVFRFFTGIGGAFCFLSCIRLATRWFPSHRMALISGLIVTMAMTGGMVAQSPMTHLAEAFGWRHALLIDAALGLVVFIIIWFAVRDYPPGTKKQIEEQKQQLQNIGFWKSTRLSYLNLQNWFCGIYTSLMNLPISLLGALWGGIYLKQVHHFSANQAAIVASMIFIGTIVGSPVAGWLSDKIGKRRPIMFIGTILSFILIGILLYLPVHTVFLDSIIFLGLGFFSSSQVVSYPTVAESNIPSLTATSVSVVSFTAIGGYAVFQPLFGWLMDKHWLGLKVHGEAIYSASNFHLALLIIPIGFIVAMLAAFLIKETHCKPVI